MARFEIVAGRYEGNGEENIKFIDSAKTLASAMAIFKKVKDYPFARIEVTDASGNTVELEEHDLL